MPEAGNCFGIELSLERDSRVKEGDRTMRILIVEDEFIIAEDLRLTLQDFGHEVIAIVSSGEEAIVYTDKFIPDIIFMDIKLDGKIDGIDAARKIRVKHEIPIVFCSANIDKITKKETTQIKPGIFISKPIEEFKIKTALNNFMGQSYNTNLALQ